MSNTIQIIGIFLGGKAVLAITYAKSILPSQIATVTIVTTGTVFDVAVTELTDDGLDFVSSIYDIFPSLENINPQLNLTFNYDPSGVGNENDLRLAFYNGSAWQDAANFTVNTDENNITARLTHTSLWTIIADLTPPEIRIQSPNGGVFKQGADTLTISASITDLFDTDPEITNMFLRHDSFGQIVAVSNSEEVVDFDARLGLGGFWRLIVEGEDASGNETAVEGTPFEIIEDNLSPRTTLDVSAPSAIGSFDGSAFGETFVTAATLFSFSAVDDLVSEGDGEGFGVEEIRFAIDEESYQVFELPFTLVGLPDGLRVIKFGAIDIAGNAEDDQTFTIRLDNTPPAIELSIGTPQFIQGDSVFVTDSTLIHATAIDAGVGVAFLDSTPTTTLGGVSVVSFTALDHLANQSDTSIILYKDNFAPTTEITIDITDTTGTVLIPESFIDLSSIDTWRVSVGDSNFEYKIEVNLDSFDRRQTARFSARIKLRNNR